MDYQTNTASFTAPRPTPWLVREFEWPELPGLNYVVQRPQPCMFDSLPPGIYGLVCPCPKCTVRF